MGHHLRTTRRSFLKHVGAAGAGTLALPYILPSGAWGAAAGGRLNVGLLACGGRTRQLLGSIVGGGCSIVAVCDVDARRVDGLKKQAAEKHGDDGKSVADAKVYEDYRKLLEAEKGVEAVVIAAGQRWHVPMAKAALAAGKHVFCEKPLAHSVAEAREIRELARQSKLATQVGSQGGSSDTFRRSMEVIQAGLLGQIKEVHAWINRGFAPSAAIDANADPIPEGLNWDFWCGPSALLPFKEYYLRGCLAWGRWLEFGDGHLADMGAHGLNLPWRALKLGAAERVSVEIPEPLKDSYPSASKFRWDFAARPGMDAAALWWHDGGKAGPPEELGKELLSTYDKVPSDGVLFVGEKGLLKSNAWGVGGVVKLKGDAKFRGVQDHEAAKDIPVTLPRAKGQNHMGEWIAACKGETKTFQGFDTAADVAEIAMTGMVALRLGKPIEWDSAAMKVKNAPEAAPLVHREQRKKWL
jgi:hypothetical protein